MISTGNTKIPSYLTIIKKGYKVALNVESSTSNWTANNGQMKFIAKDLDALLGIITMSEIRGENWVATPSEISNFMDKFPDLKK